jgi:hypothetical protein
LRVSMASKPWFHALLASRKISSRGEELTSTSLAKEIGGEVRVASAWLCKFERWGYVKKLDQVMTGRRWSWSWVVTRWGTRAREKRGKSKGTHLKMAANPPEEKE